MWLCYVNQFSYFTLSLIYMREPKMMGDERNVTDVDRLFPESSANLFLFSIGKSAYTNSDMLNIFHISP